MLTYESKSKGQKGQALIVGVLAMTVVFIIGVIVVDFGLWFSERRGAQKDADASTLAGAYELLGQDFVNLGNNNPAVTKANAQTAVYTWANLNDLPNVDVKDMVIDDTDCLGPSPVVDTVQLSAEHHSGAPFGSIFGLVTPQIGAPAKACLGSINTANGLLPFGIQVTPTNGSGCWQDVNGDGQPDPLFGQECVISFGAGQQTSGEAGRIRLYDDGSVNCSSQSTGGGNNWDTETSNGGANTTCHTYRYFQDPSKSCADDSGGCVYSLTGSGSNPELSALNTLVSKEGTAGYNCDATFGNVNGIDELLETTQVINGAAWPGPKAVFAHRDCKTPRIVSLVIVNQFGVQGNPPMPIVAFASFFLEGCQVGTKFSAKCDKKELNGQTGQTQLKGFFLNILQTDGGVGQISEWAPKRIVLVD